jgi:hypothetical protein
VLTAAASAAAETPGATATVKAPPFARRVIKRATVAVLGVAVTASVTAWLFPAMTRQWTDRQKEHELKAAVVADMAGATARALVGGEAIWGRQPLTRQAQARVGDDWELSALAIEARIRVYFPQSAVTSWEIYSWAVDRFINARRVSAAAALQDAVGPRVKLETVTLDPAVADAVAELLVRAQTTEGSAPNYGADPGSVSSRRNLIRLRRILSSNIKTYQDGQMVVSTWTALEKELLVFEQTVADQILRSHATGFSTTPRDLLHDLLL